VGVKAFMRVKKSLCGSAAVPPESKKAGQGREQHFSASALFYLQGKYIQGKYTLSAV